MNIKWCGEVFYVFDNVHRIRSFKPTKPFPHIKIIFYFHRRIWQFRHIPLKNIIMESFISIPLVAVIGEGAVSSTPSQNARFIQSVVPATAGQIALYPTALSQITVIEDVQAASTRTKLWVSSLTVAQVQALITAANANVAGLGTSGDAVLVAGTVAVTVPGLTTTSKAVLTRHIANTTTLTVEYQYAVSANTLTITAAVAAGTINVADVSTITYAIVG